MEIDIRDLPIQPESDDRHSVEVEFGFNNRTAYLTICRDQQFHKQVTVEVTKEGLVVLDVTNLGHARSEDSHQIVLFDSKYREATNDDSDKRDQAKV